MMIGFYDVAVDSKFDRKSFYKPTRKAVAVNESK